MQARGDDLDGLEGLQDTHGADDGAEDAALAAADDALGRGRLGEDASVAGRGGGRRRGACFPGGRWRGEEDALRCGRAVEDDELAVGAQGRGGDEGLAHQDAGVGDEVARGWVVCAVEDEVVGADDGLCVLWGEVFPVWDVFWERVESVAVVLVLRITFMGEVTYSLQ